jgi:hypothetical protein
MPAVLLIRRRTLTLAHYEAHKLSLRHAHRIGPMLRKPVANPA